MGFNHKLAGYSSVHTMIRDFMDDEENHLEAMVEFITATGLDDDLRRHDWRGFARGYNGAGYAKHGYHLKLARAFNKWSKVKDTPYKPNTKRIDRTPDAPEPSPGLLERLFAALAVLFGKEATV